MIASLFVNYPTWSWDPVLLCLYWRRSYRSSYHWEHCSSIS